MFRECVFVDKLLAHEQASFVMCALHAVLNLLSIASMNYEEMLIFKKYFIILMLKTHLKSQLSGKTFFQ